MAMPFHVTEVLPTGYGIPLNQNIIVSFNEPFDAGAITDLALTVTSSDYNPADGRIYSSGSLYQLVFEPNGLFRPDTRYRAIVPSPGIRTSDGRMLEESYVWRFTTGTTIDASGTPIEWTVDEDKPEPVWSTPTSVTKVERYAPGTFGGNATTLLPDGDIWIPSGVLQLDITFNAAPSGTWDWLSGYFSLTAQDVLGYTLEGDHLASAYEVIQSPEGDSPVVTLNATAGIGTVYNTEYTLTVKSGIQASGYLPLPRDHVVSWTTQMYPVYSTSVLVRLFAGPFIQDIPNDTINRMVLAHSQRATRYHNNAIWDPVPYYVTDYVTAQSAADVIRQEYSARAGSSGQKHLGDLTIDVDVTDIVGMMKDTLTRLQDLADAALGMLRVGGRLAGPKVVVRGRHQAMQPGVAWTRLLDAGGAVSSRYSPALTSWWANESSRYEIYDQYLGGNQMPSSIHWNEFIYGLTNEGVNR